MYSTAIEMQLLNDNMLIMLLEVNIPDLELNMLALI